MEKYTIKKFFSNQHTIFDNLDKTKSPIKITTGTNKEYVLMPKEVYWQLKAAQDEQLQQAELDIRRYALSHNPKTPVNDDEMEKWLNAD
ncbi:hypothetical protein HC026_03430 [Lactobacillus sp. LC28-10]|uniref:Prevent-host-death protein n=1 Tax=Secundilactobacillus angelensis TaxID=2722706 RepID=A0ABX1KVN9_9LACO|nr:hypothetical protein [Secundilactobacillus angelensis]MCH5461676.1 hypothetical protein [Secundilactobacillus angelensis]NLR17972.1 hypothetical protein [Secundilactobacillus angelensis]